MPLEEGAEAGRRLGEPVDLLLELGDLVARLAQGLREPLVLARHGGERALGVGQAQLEAAGGPGRVGQAPAEVGDLALQVAHLAQQLLAGGLAWIAVWSEPHWPEPWFSSDVGIALTS